MGLFARLLGRKPYPKSPLLEQAMRVPEPAPEPKGVWAEPETMPIEEVGTPYVIPYSAAVSDGVLNPDPMPGPLPTSEFLRRVAHPDKRDRLIEWMEAAANGTIPRDGKGRFSKKKPGGAL